MSNIGLDHIQYTEAAKMALQKAKECHLTLTSAWRSPEHSVEVGGRKDDDHTKGLAFDFAGSYANMDKFAKWAKKSHLYRWIGWQVAGHYNHVHVSWYPGNKSVTVPPSMKNGDKGENVSVLQRLLGKLKMDGIFGPKTEEAVKQFQKDNDLRADGIVGKNTWGKLTGGTGIFFYK